MSDLSLLTDRAQVPVTQVPGNDLSVLPSLTDNAIGKRGAALSVSLAASSPPDRAAEAAKIARRYGLTPDVAEQFSTEYKARAAAEDSRAVFDKAPKLGAWIDEQPDRARLVHDDLDNMGEMEIAIRRFGDVGGGLVGQAVGGTLRGAGELYDIATRALAAPIKAVGGPLDRFLSQRVPNPGDIFLGAPGRYLGQVGDKMDSGDKTFVSDVARGGGQFLGQAAVQFFTGGSLSMATLFAQGADIMKKKTAGDPSSQAAKDVAAIGGGAVTAITEKFSLDLVLGPLAVPVKNALAAALVRVGIAASAEGAQEMAENVGQDALRKLLTNEAAEFSSLADVAYEGGVGATVGGIARALIESALHIKSRGSRGYAQAQQAEEHGAALEQLAKFGAASKTLARDAQTVREFVGQVAGEGGDAPTEFFIDGEQLVNTLNQSGMSREEFAALAPEAAAQIEAAAHGGLVRLPASEFVGMGDKAVPLIDHIRTAEDMPSRAESREFMAGQGKELQADVERELTKRTDSDAFRESIASVQEHFTQQLVAAGQTSDVARANATLTANWYGTMAARSGDTLAEFAQKYRLDVVNQALAAKPGARTLGQGNLLDTNGLENKGRELVQGKAQELSDMLTEKGFEVTLDHSGSAMGPSSYLTAYDPQTGRYLSGLRVSGHSKGSFNSQFVHDVATPEDFASVVNRLLALRAEGPGQAFAAADARERVAIQKRLASAAKKIANGKDLTKSEQELVDSGAFDPADPNILNQSPQRDMIELKKREAVLKRLVECV